MIIKCTTSFTGVCCRYCNNSLTYITSFSFITVKLCGLYIYLLLNSMLCVITASDHLFAGMSFPCLYHFSCDVIFNPGIE